MTPGPGLSAARPAASAPDTRVAHLIHAHIPAPDLSMRRPGTTVHMAPDRPGTYRGPTKLPTAPTREGGRLDPWRR